ncbi:hypothetical protein R1sor_009799 [Riccia sorocarpa]|uniref:Uncharacterized protein n=1 Tax=Riccia sorocarpa TaxID=122646 RepID=A0ABD3HWF2_9MARC
MASYFAVFMLACRREDRKWNKQLGLGPSMLYGGASESTASRQDQNCSFPSVPPPVEFLRTIQHGFKTDGEELIRPELFLTLTHAVYRVASTGQHAFKTDGYIQIQQVEEDHRLRTSEAAEAKAKRIALPETASAAKKNVKYFVKSNKEVAIEIALLLTLKHECMDELLEICVKDTNKADQQFSIESVSTSKRAIFRQQALL